MKKLLAITLALLLPSGAMAQCVSTDAACFRLPGDLSQKAKIDSSGNLILDGTVDGVDVSAADHTDHGDGANCAAGQVAGGVDANGAAESCLDPITETELNSLGALNTQIGSGLVTGPHTVAHGNGANCAAGSYPLGVDANGAVESCTVAGGGSGHTISSGPITNPGLNTLTSRSTMTFDTTFFDVTDDSTNDTTFVSLNQNIGNETWIVVDEVSGSGVTELGFTGLSASEHYKITFKYTQTTIANLTFRVNGDGSSVYHSAGQCENTGGFPTYAFASNANGYIYETGGVDSGESISGEIDFQTASGNTVNARTSVISTQDNTAGCRGSVEYGGSSPMSSVEIDVTAGTMDGTAKLWKLAPMAVGAAISVPASTFTVIGVDVTTTDQTFLSCLSGSTVTMTTAGGDLEISFNGRAQGASGSWGLGFMLDGEFTAPYGPTVAKNVFWYRDNVGSYENDASFTAHVEGVSEGSHSVCLTGADEAGTTLTVECATAACQFGMREVRNVAGTGDVASNGDNTYTGTNTFAKTRMTCPSGFTEIEAQGRALGCMQTAEEDNGGSNTWYVAQDDCFDTHGGRLPYASEWYTAMANYALTAETDDNEFTADVYSTNATVIGNTAITALNTVGVTSTVPAYRCWIPK